MVKVTPIVVEHFKNWLRRVFPEDFDLQVTGIDVEDPESIRRYLAEMCEDLEYRECLNHLIKVYEGVVKRREGGEEALEEAIKELNYYYGTPYPSDAFKVLYQRIGDAVFEELEKPNHGALKPIETVLALKYMCEDFDVRRLTELPYLGFKIQYIQYGDVYTFAQQLAGAMNLRPARSLLELFGSPLEIGVASRIDDVFLVCIQGYREGSVSRGTVVASAREPFMLLHYTARLYGIIE